MQGNQHHRFAVIISGLACTLVVSTIGLAQSAAQQIPNSPRQALTIQQAIDEGVQSNLGLLAQRVDLSIAEAQVITAGLRPNPVASFSADHLDVLGTGFSETNGAGPSEVAFRVDVPFERGHKRQLRVQTAAAQRDIAEARLLESIRELQRDVAVACIDVIQQKAALQLSQQNLKTFEDLVQVNFTRVKAGSIPQLELTRSQVAMLQFRANVKRAELSLVTARIKVQDLLGRSEPEESFDIVGTIGAPLSAASLTLASLREAAFAHRPDVQVMEMEQARSQYDLKLQLAQGKMDLTWGAEYRRQQGVNGTGNSAGIFLSVPMPVYNRNQGEIARAQAEEEQLQKQMTALKSQVQAEVATSLQAFESARELVSTIQGELLNPAQQARDIADYVYRSGGSSLIEFLDAQRAFNETMQSYLEAQSDYRRATIQLNSSVNEELVQ
jgi:cobalt-zinc-cadmium efflux system outer membrane protein